jgi:hypothetical protein
MRARLTRALIIAVAIVVVAVLVGVAAHQLTAALFIAVFVAMILLVNTSRLKSHDGEQRGWRKRDGSWHSKHEQ